MFDFELDEEDMTSLDKLTTAEAIEKFKELYVKCVVRDTPLSLDDPGVKRDITAG